MDTPKADVSSLAEAIAELSLRNAPDPDRRVAVSNELAAVGAPGADVSNVALLRAYDLINREALSSVMDYDFSARKHRLWTFTQAPEWSVGKDELHAYIIETLNVGLRPEWYVLSFEPHKSGMYHCHVVCAYGKTDPHDHKLTYAKYKSNWIRDYRRVYKLGHIDSKLLNKYADVSNALKYVHKEGSDVIYSDKWCQALVEYFMKH
jgi:hypothetical protein